TKTTRETITFFAQRKLLKNTSFCNPCGTRRSIVRENCQDEIIWRCTHCRSKKAIRDQSFCSGSHLSLPSLLIFMYCWRHLDGDIVPAVVEIDETFVFKRKYNRGRVNPGKWIFGGIQRDLGIGFLVEVPDRTRQTLERHHPAIHSTWYPHHFRRMEGLCKLKSNSRGIYTIQSSSMRRILWTQMILKYTLKTLKI
ncbi:hypothetical protein TCAL_16390, partial [Tigriopus californicus]